MNGTRVPCVRRVCAAALVAILSCAWISPPQAFAQLPPLPGRLVVTITSPTSDTTVAGTITVRARVSTVGLLVAEDTSAPYSVSWDTTTTSNGFHTLMAVARDALGIRFTSDPVTVTVSNAAPPPTVTRVEETDSSITYTDRPAEPRLERGIRR